MTDWRKHSDVGIQASGLSLKKSRLEPAFYALVADQIEMQMEAASKKPVQRETGTKA